MAPARITNTETVDQHLPKGSMNSGGPRGPATVIVDGNDRSFAQQHANAGAAGAMRSDAVKEDNRPYSTLNDSFHYPSY